MDERLNDEQLTPELKRALEELIARAERAVAAVDSERVATRVVERLRAEPEQRRSLAWSARTLALAASVAVVVIAGATVREVLRQSAPASEKKALPLGVYADTLSVSQAEAILELVAEPGSLNGNASPTSASVTIEDLTESELRTLLQVLEQTEE
ncbi:MAG TPA: hypothetical protein VNL98_09480 [Gemmatimonadales bacterium]|nr:hypothetical protein [Gemmatimonadales bacterium]